MPTFQSIALPGGAPARSHATLRPAPLTILIAATALLVSCLQTGCGRQAQSPAPPAAATPIPEIDLSAWPEGVRKAGGEAQARARSSPNDPEAVGELGMRYYAYDFPAAGAACFERACQLAPKSLKWQFYRGISWQKAGDSAKAIEALEKAAAIDATYGPALVTLADLLLETDPARSEQLYRNALKVRADDATAELGLGHWARRAGRQDEALAHYRRAIEIYPDYAEAHYGLALVLASAGKKEESAAQLKKHAAGGTPPLTNDPLRLALLKLKENEKLLRDQAERLYRQGDTQGAVALLGRAVEIDESGSTSHIHLGVMLAREGKLEQAAQEFRLALEADPRNIEAKSSLGLALADLHREDEAIRLYHEVLQQNPDHAPTLVYLGQLLSRQGKTEEALADLRRGVDLQPANGLYQFTLGDLLARTGQNAEAVTHLRKAANLMPQAAPIRYILGVVLARSGDRSGARTEWREAVRVDPKFPDAYAAMANAALEDHDASTAVGFAEKACTLTDYRKPPFVEILVRAYQAAGRPADAAAATRRAAGGR